MSKKVPSADQPETAAKEPEIMLKPITSEDETELFPLVPLAEDATVRRIIQVLRNGKVCESSRFAAHSFLVRFLYRYWETDNADQFVRTLKDYFRQALYLVPQTATPEEASELLEQVTTVILTHGFKPTARHILGGLNAP